MARPDKKKPSPDGPWTDDGQVPPRPPRNNGRTSPDRSSGVLTFEMTPPRRTNGASSHDDEVQLLLSTSANAPREGTHTNGALGPPSPRHAHHGHGLGDGEKCGVYKTLANIFISFIGAGILGLPSAFKGSGIILGVAFMVCLSGLAFYCILLLVDCKKLLEHKGVASYPEVAEAALGRWGKAAVDVFLVLSQTGFCVAYVIFIYGNLPLVDWSPQTIVLLVIPFQAMLAMLRDLSALAPFSLLADAAHVCGMLVVLKDDVQHFRAAHEAVAASKGWGAVPVLFGVVIYCYEGIGMILQIEDSMKDRSKFRSTLTLGFGTITTIFLVFGAAGYLAYGETTKDPITKSLPEDWTTHTVKLALCLALFFTFPVMMVPVYDILERGTEAMRWFQTSVSPLRRALLFRLIRIAMVTLVGLIAISVPGFTTFIAFVGSFACSSLAFILPAACHLVLFRDKLSRAAAAMDYFLMAFGFTGMVFGVAHSIQDMAAGVAPAHG